MSAISMFSTLIRIHYYQLRGQRVLYRKFAFNSPRRRRPKDVRFRASRINSLRKFVSPPLSPPTILEYEIHLRTVNNPIIAQSTSVKSMPDILQIYRTMNNKGPPHSTFYLCTNVRHLFYGPYACTAFTKM